MFRAQAGALSSENAGELIGFAASHTQRETDREVARLMDRREPKRENLQVASETLELLKKTQSALASRQKRHLKPDEALKLVLEEFLDRHEPVRKAERARKRERNSVQAGITATKSRKPIPARTKHAVMIRDQARCTFIDLAGNRCPNDRWLHLHHLRPVSQCGSDEPENLATLCSFHHELVHKLSLPPEGQINWLREPSRSIATKTKAPALNFHIKSEPPVRKLTPLSRYSARRGGAGSHMQMKRSAIGTEGE